MPDFGVIIPVFRGAAVLHRSVDSLTGQRLAGTVAVHVVIAVNDDDPRSWAAAESAVASLELAGHGARAVESTAGRAAAFGAAERVLPPGARLYLDQDAALSPGAVVGLAEILTPGTGVHFAAPRLRLAPGVSRWTRLYHEGWQAAPYAQTAPATMGAYAVSEEGRRRWQTFPQIHSDDKWVRLHFAPSERAIVDGESYEVVPPQGWAELVRARRRYNRGNAELRRVELGTIPSEEHRYAGLARALLGRPQTWPAAGALTAVVVAARLGGDRARASDV